MTDAMDLAPPERFDSGPNAPPSLIDARNLAQGPVAIVKFPCRVHEGFHGVFVPDSAL